jgi:hypothetical protein
VWAVVELAFAEVRTSAALPSRVVPASEDDKRPALHSPYTFRPGRKVRKLHEEYSIGAGLQRNRKNYKKGIKVLGLALSNVIL